MRIRLLVCVAVAVIAHPVSAVASPAPGTCVAGSDAKGDVELKALTNKQNVDVVSARVVATPKGITATITVDGEPDPLPGEVYVYQLYFTQPEKVYELLGTLSGGLAPVYQLYEGAGTFDSGTGASTSSWRKVPGATGSVDVARRSVTLHAPASALGTIRPGRTWTVPLVQGGHGYVATYGPVDDLTPRPRKLVAGDGRCR